MSERVDGIIPPKMAELIETMLLQGQLITDEIAELTDEQRETIEITLLGDMLLAFASSIAAINALARADD